MLGGGMGNDRGNLGKRAVEGWMVKVKGADFLEQGFLNPMTLL